MLDLYTIQSELGCIGGMSGDQPMVVTMLGDLKHGRTVHSLAKLLGRFKNIKIQYVAPDLLAMPEEVLEILKWIQFLSDRIQSSLQSLNVSIYLTFYD